MTDILSGNVIQVLARDSHNIDFTEFDARSGYPSRKVIDHPLKYNTKPLVSRSTNRNFDRLLSSEKFIPENAVFNGSCSRWSFYSRHKCFVTRSTSCLSLEVKARQFRYCEKAHKLYVSMKTNNQSAVNDSKKVKCRTW